MENKDFLLVGIGASAGGTEEIYKFFSNLTDPTQAAYIIVRHILPNHISEFPRFLQKRTSLKVVRIEGNERVEPGCIYVLPEGKKVKINDGHLVLVDRGSNELINFAIDEFFYSLADYARERAVAVVLSGFLTDGAKGAKYLKEQGGIVLVQHPDTAKVKGMPKETIAIDHPNFVVKVEQMPQIILERAQRMERQK